MIPKKIHYVWFGNEKNKLMKRCIDSWKKLNYEVYEWNEKTYDINKNDFVKEAYKKQNWAFLSDYIRLDVLYNLGGIYIDTDVLLIKKTSLNKDVQFYYLINSFIFSPHHFYILYNMDLFLMLYMLLNYNILYLQLLI